MGIMEELIAALKENTATLKALSGKTAAAAGGAESKSASTKTPAEDGGEEKRGRGRPPKAKALSVTEMAEKAREFCEAAGEDEDDFKDRRKFVSKLAEKFGAIKFSDIKGDDQKEAIEALADFAAAGGDDDGGY